MCYLSIEVEGKTLPFPPLYMYVDRSCPLAFFYQFRFHQPTPLPICFHFRLLASRFLPSTHRERETAVVKVKNRDREGGRGCSSPVPALARPITCFFHSGHAVVRAKRGAHPAAFPLYPFRLMGIRAADADGRTSGLSPPLSSLAPHSLDRNTG